MHLLLDLHTLLDMYSLRFLCLFQDNKNLGKDSLKFAKNFAVKVEHQDTTQVGSKEDWYTASYILKEHGSSIADFKTVEDALECVRYLCRTNQEQTGYEPKPEVPDEKYPQFTKFWYVWSLGKVEQHTSSCGKKLEGESELKNLDQLELAKCFMEGLGYNNTASSSVKIENAKSQELQKQVE